MSVNVIFLFSFIPHNFFTQYVDFLFDTFFISFRSSTANKNEDFARGGKKMKNYEFSRIFVTLRGNIVDFRLYLWISVYLDVRCQHLRVNHDRVVFSSKITGVKLFLGFPVVTFIFSNIRIQWNGKKKSHRRQNRQRILRLFNFVFFFFRRVSWQARLKNKK